MGRPLPEAELVRRAKRAAQAAVDSTRRQRGDEAAYEELVKIHREVAFRTAYLIAGSAADAEEAAQDGFVKAYRALARFRDGLPFRPWLLQIVANEARNRRRAAGRREFLAVRAAAESVSGGAAPSPETAVLAAAERDELVRAISTLREEDRLVIACRHFLELGQDETAAVLGVPAGTVKSRHSRALERLRQRLEGVQ